MTQEENIRFKAGLVFPYVLLEEHVCLAKNIVHITFSNPCSSKMWTVIYPLILFHSLTSNNI